MELDLVIPFATQSGCIDSSDPSCTGRIPGPDYDVYIACGNLVSSGTLVCQIYVEPLNTTYDYEIQWRSWLDVFVGGWNPVTQQFTPAAMTLNWAGLVKEVATRPGFPTRTEFRTLLPQTLVSYTENNATICRESNLASGLLNITLKAIASPCFDASMVDAFAFLVIPVVEDRPGQMDFCPTLGRITEQEDASIWMRLVPRVSSGASEVFNSVYEPKAWFHGIPTGIPVGPPIRWPREFVESSTWFGIYDPPRNPGEIPHDAEQCYMESFDWFVRT